MKKLIHIFGTKQKIRTNTIGEPINTILGSAKLKTIVPEGYNPEDKKALAEWSKKFRFGKSFSRFEVCPLSNNIINKNKLVLERVYKF
jgi:hypothetical protein